MSSPPGVKVKLAIGPEVWRRQPRALANRPSIEAASPPANWLSVTIGPTITGSGVPRVTATSINRRVPSTRMVVGRSVPLASAETGGSIVASTSLPRMIIARGRA
jgi:hypothetical protein